MAQPLQTELVDRSIQTRFWNQYPGPQIQVTDTSAVPSPPEYSVTVSPRVSGEWAFLREPRLSGELRIPLDLNVAIGVQNRQTPDSVVDHFSGSR